MKPDMVKEFMEINFCPKCGGKVEAWMFYCPSCRFNLKEFERIKKPITERPVECVFRMVEEYIKAMVWVAAFFLSFLIFQIIFTLLNFKLLFELVLSFTLALGLTLFCYYIYKKREKKN
ncbi:MAG: hypothetical protein QXZ53_07275 [Candidatus Bathyarchaeia archaeon]